MHKLLERLFLRNVILYLCIGILSGCTTTQKQNSQSQSLTPEQQKQIQQLNAMQARWRNSDMLMYNQVPGGGEAWQEMQTETNGNFD